MILDPKDKEQDKTSESIQFWTAVPTMENNLEEFPVWALILTTILGLATGIAAGYFFLSLL